MKLFFDRTVVLETGEIGGGVLSQKREFESEEELKTHEDFSEVENPGFSLVERK